MAKKQVKALRFVGQRGQHLTGVPARDLNVVEVGQLNTKEYDHLLASGLYAPAEEVEGKGDKR